MPRPATANYPEYFGNYINQVMEEDVLEAFENQLPVVEKFMSAVNEERSNYSYAPGKWTIKELWQHVIDGERVFSYRALCIARKETENLPSFDENDYASNSNANARSWESLQQEFTNVRRSTVDLYKSFTDEMLAQKGKSNNREIDVLSLGFTIVGHLNHHLKVLREKYNIIF